MARSFMRVAEPWAYLSPALVLLILVLLVPLIIGIGYSFRHFTAFNSRYVGLGEYRAMLRDPALGQALFNTLWWTAGSLFFQFLLGLGLALLLNRRFRGRAVVQAVVFLPWAVPSFLAGLTWAWLFNPIIGPIPHWLLAVGLQAKPRDILAIPSVAMWGPIIANIWFGIPFFAITLLAALKSIPADLYEAATLDGAGRWRQFWHITLPGLRPMIYFAVTLSVIGGLQLFDEAFILTNGHGGPDQAGLTAALYFYREAFDFDDFGGSAAMSWILFCFVALLTWLTNVALRPRDAEAGS